MKLSIKQTIMIGLAFGSICLFWEAYNNLMPLMLDTFGLNKVVIGLIMAADAILALFVMPLMGLLSDRARTKWGRRVPFIVAGSVFAAVTFLLINLAFNLNILWLFIALPLLLVFAMCCYRTPAVSLMPDVTPKPLRSKGNAVINIMGLIGGVIFLVLSLPVFGLIKTEKINEHLVNEKLILTGNNWLIVGAVSVLMVISAVVVFMKVKEPRLVEEREKAEKEAGIYEETPVREKRGNIFSNIAYNFKQLSKPQRVSLIFLLVSVFLWYFSYNAAKTWFSTISLQLLNDPDFSTPLLLANVAGFAMYIPSAIIGNKIGRRNTVMLGLFLMAVGFFTASMVIFNSASLSPGFFKFSFMMVFVFVGAGWATLNVHSYVMSVEMADKSNTGFFTGLYYIFTMSAMALTPIISGALMETKLGMEILFPYSLVFAVLPMGTMLFVKHGNAKKIESNK